MAELGRLPLDVGGRPRPGADGLHSPKRPFEHATPACYHGTWLHPQDAVRGTHGEVSAWRS
ncbi:hypothetical protein BVI1335_320097 [Burkholderia vietnamiensis]|nr:hypothetical protein BVI1335_320097 [Burkholderia vietnamiensis]